MIGIKFDYIAPTQGNVCEIVEDIACNSWYLFMIGNNQDENAVVKLYDSSNVEIPLSYDATNFRYYWIGRIFTPRTPATIYYTATIDGVDSNNNPYSHIIEITCTVSNIWTNYMDI